MNTRIAALLASLLTLSLAGCRPSENAEPAGAESTAINGIADDTEASQASLDASELALGGSALPFAGSPGCVGTVTGSDEISACGRALPGTRTVSWSCAGPSGNGVTGSATVVTTLLDSSSCPDVAIRQAVSFSRTTTAGEVSADLAGTAQLDLVLDSANHTAQSAIVLDVTREVYSGEALVRDQHVTGTRVADLAANGSGTEDDTRTVNGSTTIDFALDETQLNLGATDLFWSRGCCHPVGGRIDWQLSGSESGSLRFGPACGEALRADDSAVALAPCPAFQ